MVTARESTSLSIMWQLLSTTSTVTTYTISYSNINNTECYNDSNTITDISNSMTMLILDNLEEYSIIVTATLSNSLLQQDSTSATTLSTGKLIHNYYASGCKNIYNLQYHLNHLLM